MGSLLEDTLASLVGSIKKKTNLFGSRDIPSYVAIFTEKTKLIDKTFIIEQYIYINLIKDASFSLLNYLLSKIFLREYSFADTFETQFLRRFNIADQNFELANLKFFFIMKFLPFKVVVTLSSYLHLFIILSILFISFSVPLDIYLIHGFFKI